MGRIPTFIIVLLTAAGAGFARQPTSQSWELRGREWQRIESPAADAAPADPRVDAIERLVESGQGKQAFKEAVAFLKINAGHPERDRALFLAARGLYLTNDRTKAFYYCDELLDTYPESPYYQPALEFQYRLADEYLSGYKGKVLGFLTIGDMSEEAIEMLFRVQQRAPGSQLAEKALLRTADYYYSRADYDLAGDAYAAYVRSYPRSPEVPRVRLLQSYAYLAQFRGLKFDATPVADARAQLTDLMATHPQLAADENIPQLLERIDSTFAQKLLTTADYYRRIHKPTAAAYMCQMLLNTYPNSVEADEARRVLEALPPSAVEEAQTPPVQPTASAQ